MLVNGFGMKRAHHARLPCAPLIRGGIAFCALMFAVPGANAVTDVPELALADSINLALIHFVEARQSTPAEFANTGHAAWRYGDLNWPVPEPFDIVLRRADGMGESLPVIQVESPCLSLSTASCLVVSFPDGQVQREERPSQRSEPQSDPRPKPLQRSDYEGGTGAFLLASAYAPAALQPDLPDAATRTAVPPPIERSTFLPTLQGLSLTMGVDYSSGTYGGPARVDTVYMPLTLKYEWRRWGLRLAIPYVEVTESEVYVDRWGQVVDYSATNSGLGDISAAVTYYAWDNQDFTAGIDLSGKVKFGTADRQRGLGSGENDYSAQLNGYWSAGRFTASMSGGYKILGKPPRSNLHNVFYGSLGAGYKVSRFARMGVTLDQRQRSSVWGSPQREVSMYFSYGFGKNLNIQGYLLKGLADGSPDRGGGVTVMLGMNP